MDPEFTWRDSSDGYSSSVDLEMMSIRIHRRGWPNARDERALVYLEVAEEYAIETWRFEDDPSLLELKARAVRVVADRLRGLAERISPSDGIAKLEARLKRVREEVGAPGQYDERIEALRELFGLPLQVVPDD